LASPPRPLPGAGGGGGGRRPKGLPGPPPLSGDPGGVFELRDGEARPPGVPPPLPLPGLQGLHRPRDRGLLHRGEPTPGTRPWPRSEGGRSFTAPSWVWRSGWGGGGSGRKAGAWASASSTP